MKKQISLWIKQLKSSDFQTLRLFAILAGLTLIFVIMLTVVQISPAVSNSFSTEAKLSP